MTEGKSSAHVVLECTSVAPNNVPELTPLTFDLKKNIIFSKYYGHLKTANALWKTEESLQKNRTITNMSIRTTDSEKHHFVTRNILTTLYNNI